MRMDLNFLKETFYSLVSPDIPNEWEVEEALEPLAGDRSAEIILGQVPVIWPISNSLCYNYLGQAQKALSCISLEELPVWVNETLDHYEEGGLRAAQQFMVGVELHFTCSLRNQGAVRLDEIKGWLLPYIQGLAGRTLDLAPAPLPATDTQTVYVPVELSAFESAEDNILLYKLLAGYQWVFMSGGTFFPEAEPRKHPDTQKEHLQQVLASFSNPELATFLYHALETFRAGFVLQRELPGLIRATGAIRKVLCEERVTSGDGVLATLERGCCLFDSAQSANFPPWFTDVSRKLGAADATAATSLDLCRELYAGRMGQPLEEPCKEPLLLQGEFRLQAVYTVHTARKKRHEEEFVEALATYLLQLPQAEEIVTDSSVEEAGSSGENGSGQAIVMEEGQGTEAESTESLYLTINNESIELPDELRQMADILEADFHSDPARYVNSAVGRAGQAMARGEFAPEADQPEAAAKLSYDEWDYRRNGYRKNWCVLIEREISLLRSNFVPVTLNKYRGQIIRLRNQFEMLRNQERFIRRQRDGDDIDFDALVESIGDARAGLPPSDRLFVRLKRDERDIAALFLVDMSNSTEGWVGTAIKESLVLMCEAMEVLGDRYGIYGFSGMRRLRCETFHIKHIEEPYSEEVKQRIGSIAPREYTRMAPAIRHGITLLQEVDARIRLLITLSDGKPEDYDGYKGEYAVEDTRHALLEARSVGLHPFCVTVDQHAHDYMAHMYGDVNYIFIDDVRKLPARMVEVYRVLTS